MRDLFNNIIIIPKWKTKGYFETWKKIISIEHASNQWDSYVFSILKKNVDLLLNFFSFIHAISNNNQAIYIQHIPYMHIKSKETIFRHEMRNSLLNKKKTTGTYQPKSQINNNKYHHMNTFPLKLNAQKYVSVCLYYNYGYLVQHTYALSSNTVAVDCDIYSVISYVCNFHFSMHFPFYFNHFFSFRFFCFLSVFIFIRKVK